MAHKEDKSELERQRRQKLERIRHAGPVVEAAQLSDEQVERIKAILDGYGLVVTIH